MTDTEYADDDAGGEVEEKGLFRSFPEIRNHYDKTVEKYVAEHSTDELWVATEKIHGANFCFIHDGATLTPAKRTSILEAKDSFMNYQVIVKRYENALKNLFERVKEVKPDMVLVRVFGEFYGGHYDGKSEKGVKTIQKGVNYCPGIDFEAFDIFYETEDDKSKQVLDYTDAVEIFEGVGLPYAQILAQGTVKDLLSTLNPETMESAIYAKHGLPKMERNLAEGYVLKPNKALFIDHERISIKLKSSKFSEILSAPQPKEKKEKPAKQAKELSQAETEIIEKAMLYINQNRLDGIVSKLNDDDRAEKKVIGLLISDAFKDFVRAESPETVKTANSLKSVIMPRMREAAVNLFSEQQS